MRYFSYWDGIYCYHKDITALYGTDVSLCYIRWCAYIYM